MWDGFNKRKFPRIKVRCQLLIESPNGSSPITTQTQNLGVGGACVVLDQPLDRFEKCRVRLFLGPKKEKVECEGKVVWAVPTSDLKSRKAKYDTGIEFEGLTEDKSYAIQVYLTAKQAK